MEKKIELIPNEFYHIDAEYRNGGKVKLISLGEIYCTVQDPDTGEAWSTMQNRLSKWTAPSPVEGETAIEFLKNQPEYKDVSVTTECSIFYHVAPNRIADLMSRYASLKVHQERNKTIQECIDLFPRIKDSWIRAELSKLKG